MNVVVTEPQLNVFLRRRFTLKELETLIDHAKELVNNEDDEVRKGTAIYDVVKEFIKSANLSDIDEHGDDASYWRSYLAYEIPLVAYINSKIS